MKFLPYLLCLFTACSLYADDDQINPPPITQSQQVTSVDPIQDLQKDHGLFRRLLLIYDEMTRIINSGQDFDTSQLQNAANIVASYFENFHEMLEETYIFPVFIQNQQMVDLVNTLQQDHATGRTITQSILLQCQTGDLQSPQTLQTISNSLQQYVTILRPHLAKEESQLFPLFQNLTTQQNYDVIGELFAGQEIDTFGQNGFTSISNQVSAIEQALNMTTLAQPTSLSKGENR